MSLMPSVLVVGSWQAAKWIQSNYSCTGYGKELTECTVFGINVATLVHIGLLLKLLVPIAVAASAGWAAYIAFGQIEVFWKRRGKRNAANTSKESL